MGRNPARAQCGSTETQGGRIGRTARKRASGTAEERKNAIVQWMKPQENNTLYKYNSRKNRVY